MRSVRRRWQRHQRERAFAGVKFGRDVIMGARVFEEHGQGALPVGMARDRDSRGFASWRALAVGADDEMRRVANVVSVNQFDGVAEP